MRKRVLGLVVEVHVNDGVSGLSSLVRITHLGLGDRENPTGVVVGEQHDNREVVVVEVGGEDAPRIRDARILRDEGLLGRLKHVVSALLKAGWAELLKRIAKEGIGWFMGGSGMPP